MEWNKKTELCRLANNLNDNPETHKNFLEYAIKNLSEFDEQSWDMFFNGIELNAVENHMDLCKEIQNKSKNLKFDNFRTAMRAQLFQDIIEGKNLFKK